MLELRGYKTNPHRTEQRDMLGIHQPEIHLDTFNCRTEKIEITEQYLKFSFHPKSKALNKLIELSIHVESSALVTSSQERGWFMRG